jgi:hypothetical protein
MSKLFGCLTASATSSVMILSPRRTRRDTP